MMQPQEQRACPHNVVHASLGTGQPPHCGKCGQPLPDFTRDRLLNLKQNLPSQAEATENS